MRDSLLITDLGDEPLLSARVKRVTITVEGGETAPGYLLSEEGLTRGLKVLFLARTVDAVSGAEWAQEVRVAVNGDPPVPGVYVADWDDGSVLNFSQ